MEIEFSQTLLMIERILYNRELCGCKLQYMASYHLCSLFNFPLLLFRLILLSYPLPRKIISQSRIAEEDKANTSCGSLVSDNSLISCCLQDRMGFPGGSVVKNHSVKQETQVQSLKVKLLSYV